MRPFDFYAPTTVVEALTLLDQYKDSVACIAGGTDLTLELNEWKAQPAVVIDLKKLKSVMACPVIVDGRNVFKPEEIRALGFTYHSVGRN